MKQFLEPWYFWVAFTVVFYACTYHLRRWLEQEASQFTVNRYMQIVYKDMGFVKNSVYSITSIALLFGAFGSVISFLYNFIRACIG